MEQEQDAETWGRRQAAAPTEQLQTRLADLKAGVRHIESLQAQAEIVKTAGESLDQAQQELRSAEQQLEEVEYQAGQSQCRTGNPVTGCQSLFSQGLRYYALSGL